MTLHLLARVAGQRIALPADSIESVVELDTVSPVPMVAPHIRGLAALRSRVLTVVDSYAALDLPAPAAADLLQAVVVVIEGHLYGLLVDCVDDVVNDAGEALPVRGALTAGWARVALGLVEHGGEPILLIDPAALVTSPDAALAA